MRPDGLLSIEPWKQIRASRHVEVGLSRSFSHCGRKPWVPSTCASDLRELLRVPLRSRDTVDLGGASRAPPQRVEAATASQGRDHVVCSSRMPCRISGCSKRILAQKNMSGSIFGRNTGGHIDLLWGHHIPAATSLAGGGMLGDLPV